MRIKSVFLWLFCSFFVPTAWAQYETIVIDYEKMYFNNGQPIQPERFLLISGGVTTNISRVEVQLFKPKSRKPLHVSSWKRFGGTELGIFQVPCNYKLRGNSEYSFTIDYFRPITNDEKYKLKEVLYSSIDAYLDQAFSSTGKKVKMLLSSKVVIRDMNSIVSDVFRNYRNNSEESFVGFSGVMQRSIKNFKGRRLHKAEAANLNNDDSDKKDNQLEGKAQLYQNRLEDVKKIAHREMETMLTSDLVIKNDTRKVESYPTENTMNILSVSVGYGGVLLNENFRNPNYASAPYVGVSLPLGNSSFSNRFWANSAISFGVFVTNMKDRNNVEYSGPVFKRPYFVGYGYKIFHFVRFNAGLTFIENIDATGSLTDRATVKPFMGISAEFNLWVGLGNKRK